MEKQGFVAENLPYLIITVFPVSAVVLVEINKRHYFWGTPGLYTGYNFRFI